MVCSLTELEAKFEEFFASTSTADIKNGLDDRHVNVILILSTQDVQDKNNAVFSREGVVCMDVVEAGMAAKV